jgi:prepilin-type N-terminal cleavage/methylation domain-containing protein
MLMDSMTRRRTERGFSLIEMLVTIAILTIVMGVIFRHLGDAQVKYASEQMKIDLVQEARAGLDGITRDLRQCGYPTPKMFGPTSPNGTDSAPQVSDTDLQFKGDVDGDGNTEAVHYKLLDNGSGNCPCTLVRSQSSIGGAENFNPVVQNVVNSSSTSPKGISGSSTAANGAIVSNDSLYGACKRPSIFQAFDEEGKELDGTSPGKIRTVRVTLNVLAPTANLDARVRPAVSMTMDVRISNNSQVQP